MAIQEENLKIIEVGSRGTVFSFYEDKIMGDTTLTYVINAQKHVFIIDTFLGPDSMIYIKDFLKENKFENPIIVVNTHSHWDHYWGNNAFGKNTTILAHSLCRRQIELDGKSILEKMREYTRGLVEIKLPNLVFEKGLSYPEDGLEFFYSPGHTLDSISCFDSVDNVLIVGDNIEDPFPYITNDEYSLYIETLQQYLGFDAKAYILGHGVIHFDKKLIEKNLKYITEFSKMSVNASIFSRNELLVHCTNLNEIGKNYREHKRYEEAIQFYEESKLLLKKSEDPKNREYIAEIQEILQVLNELKKEKEKEKEKRDIINRTRKRGTDIV
ncbi:MAG: MBL fold metallo-hydrolase [Promethearchaeota archaeon]